MNIKDLAKLSGVAPSTISKVINNYPGVSIKTKEIVLKAIKKYNYTSNVNARNLSMKKSNLIGVLMPNRTSFGLDSPFQSGILEGFRKSVSNLGYDTVFVSKKIFGQDVSYLDHCTYMNFAGILVLAYDQSDSDILQVINSGIPVVSTNFRGNESICEIYSDDYQGTTLATEYLISLGHRDIGFIGGPRGNSNSSMVRFNAFMDSMENNELHVNNNFVETANLYSLEEGLRIINNIIKKEKFLPSAIVVGSDLLAYGVIKGLKSHGYSIPRDISIIGFDDLESSRYIDPPLTTIKQDLALIGETASVKLIDLIENGINKDSIILPTKIIVRQSCRML